MGTCYYLCDMTSQEYLDLNKRTYDSPGFVTEDSRVVDFLANRIGNKFEIFGDSNDLPWDKGWKEVKS